ncbi:MAG TPA: hypothetical protein VGL23_17915 [Chloroflexota bacterium]
MAKIRPVALRSPLPSLRPPARRAPVAAPARRAPEPPAQPAARRAPAARPGTDVAVAIGTKVDARA